jgi:hypothetical protein
VARRDRTRSSAAFFGVDDEVDAIRRLYRRLYAPKVEARSHALTLAKDPFALVGGTESVMPDQFAARVVDTAHGSFGYIRIWSFMPTDLGEDGAKFFARFVAEFIRLAGLMPPKGLIIDVRSNGGGLIWAGEQLLHVLTPRRIEPARFQFVNTPAVRVLCRIQPELSAWVPSLDRAVETGARYSAGLPHRACA